MERGFANETASLFESGGVGVEVLGGGHSKSGLGRVLFGRLDKLRSFPGKPTRIIPTIDRFLSAVGRNRAIELAGKAGRRSGLFTGFLQPIALWNCLLLVRGSIL